MTPREKQIYIDALRAHTQEITRSREAARAALVSSGIYLDDGRLAPEFGGETEDLPTRKA